MKVKPFLFILAFVTCAILNSQINISQKAQEPTKSKTYDSRSFFVKIYGDLGSVEKRTGLKGKFSRTFARIKDDGLDKIYSIQFETAVKAKTFHAKFKDSSTLFEYMEYQPIFETSFTPNDYNSQLWHLDKINALKVWDIQKGKSSVTIAIVDDAIDINHPDLRNVCLKNMGEIPGNGIDDDKNGYWDDYDGWNANYKNGSVNPYITSKANFTHGTHCAGIAGAETNNSTGVASLGFGVKILPIACSDSTKPKQIINGFQGIEYAIIREADVISLSWGSLGYSITGQKIIDYAYSRGITVIAAAGNYNSSIRIYPAAYNNVIAVAATDANDKKAYFSNYGSWVDISAPGVDILSSITGDPLLYKSLSGTSMAAPLVAALCGLLKSKNKLLTPDEIEACIKNTAKNISGLNPSYAGKLGAGRIDAEAAVKCAKEITASFDMSTAYPCQGSTIDFVNRSSAAATQFRWYFEGGMPSFSSDENPKVTYNSNGNFGVKLVAFNTNGGDSIELKKIIKVENPSAVLSGEQKARVGETIYLKVDFVGQPPFQVDISSGTNLLPFSNLMQKTSYLPLTVKGKEVYRISSFRDSRCAGTYLGLGIIDTLGNDFTGNCKNPVSLFSIKLEGSKDVSPHELITLKDGNFLLAGIQSNSYIGGDDIFLSKIDQKGQLIWSKIYGTKNTEYGFPVSIEESKTGLYLGASVQPSGRWYKGYLTRLDNNGSTIWAREFQNPQTHDAIRGLCVLPNEDIIASGTSAINNVQAGEIMRFDKTGNKTWGFSLDIRNEAEHFTESILHNNSIYSFGHANYGAGVHTGWLTKTDLNGVVIWKKDIDLPWVDCCIAGVPSKDGGSIIIQGNIGWKGTTKFGNRDFYICRVDTNGTVIWNKTFGSSGFDYCTNGVYLNDYYYVAGITNSFRSGAPLPFLVKLDINGNVIWQKVYGTNNDKYDLILLSRSLTVTSDEGLLFAVQDVSSGKHTALLKFNQCGETTCESEIINFGVDSQLPKMPTSRGNRNAILSDLSYTPTIITNSSTIKSITLCPPKAQEKRKCNFISKVSHKAFCISDTLILKDESYEEDGRKIVSRIWQVNNGPSVHSGSEFKYRFLQSGQHRITLIITSDTPNVCRDTIWFDVNANNKIKGELNVFPKTICSGDSSQLTAKVSCGVNPIKVKWTSSTFNSENLNPKVSPQVNTWYTFTAIDRNGDTYQDSVLVVVDKTCCKNRASFKPSKKIACVGDTIQLEHLFKNTQTSYKWDYFYNGFLYSNRQGDNPPPIVCNKTGIFMVKLIAWGNCLSDTQNIEIECYPEPPLFVNLDTAFCSPIIFDLDAIPMEGVQYLWNPTLGLSKSNIINPTITAGKNIQYKVYAQNLKTGCTNTDTVNIFIAEKPRLPNDTAICEGTSLEVQGPTHGKFYWEDYSIDNPRRINNAGMYILTDTQTHCATKDTIEVTLKPSPKFQLDSIGTICNAQTIEINPRIDTSDLKALWENGSKYFRRFVSQEKKVILVISDSQCEWKDSMTIQKRLSPNADLGGDTTVCLGSSILLKPKTQVAEYLWNNASKDSSILVKSPGTYWLVAKNICGRDSQSINISLKKCTCTIYTPNAFSPNKNAKNEVFIQVSDCNVRDYHLRIYNRWGEKLFETFDQNKGWDGFFMGKPCPDGVYVFMITGIMEFDTYEEFLNREGVIHLLR